jgi:hypothetical protein
MTNPDGTEAVPIQEPTTDTAPTIDAPPIKVTEALAELQAPYEVNIDGRVYVLTDFVNQWNIPQMNAMLRIIKHCLGASDGSASSVFADLLGNLAEQDLTQEVMAILFIPKGQARWNSAKYREYIPDMETLTPKQAIEAITRFFCSVDLSTLGISLGQLTPTAANQ